MENSGHTTAVVRAIEKLNALTRDDPEEAHSDADDILLAAVHPDIAAAWREACKRCHFWYA